jgi:hypothetical protein
MRDTGGATTNDVLSPFSLSLILSRPNHVTRVEIDQCSDGGGTKKKVYGNGGEDRTTAFNALPVRSLPTGDFTKVRPK